MIKKEPPTGCWRFKGKSSVHFRARLSTGWCRCEKVGATSWL